MRALLACVALALGCGGRVADDVPHARLESVVIAEDCFPIIMPTDERARASANLRLSNVDAEHLELVGGTISFHGETAYRFSFRSSLPRRDGLDTIIPISTTPGTLAPKGRCALHQDLLVRGGDPVSLRVDLRDASTGAILHVESEPTPLRLTE